MHLFVSAIAFLFGSISFAEEAPEPRMPPPYQAEAKQATDYTHCAQRYVTGYTSTMRVYNVDPFSGSLAFHPSNPMVASFTRETADEETLTLKDHTHFMLSKERNPEYRAKVYLKKSDGKPQYLEHSVDARLVADYKNLSADQKEMEAPIASMRDTFAYKGNKCYVSERSLKTIDGKEQVYYHYGLCRKLIDAAKNLDPNKLVECSKTLHSLQASLKEGLRQLQKQNKTYVSGIGGSAMTFENVGKLNKDNNWLTLKALADCQQTRAMFGLSKDNDINILGTKLNLQKQTVDEDEEKESAL